MISGRRKLGWRKDEEEKKKKEGYRNDIGKRRRKIKRRLERETSTHGNRR